MIRIREVHVVDSRFSRLTSVQAGHHLIFAERLEVVDIEPFCGERGFDVRWNELVVDLWCDGEF